LSPLSSFACFSTINYRAFAFLQAVARDFSQKFSSRKIKNCDAYALNKDFTPNLRSAMHYYNINREILSRDDKINTLLSQVDDMKAVLGRNIQLMLGRGEKVDRLLAKSEQTMKDVMVFKKKSDKLKKLERLRSIKLTSIVIGMVLGITIIASVASKNA
jgi:vesicle-associated membrane protein 7